MSYLWMYTPGIIIGVIAVILMIALVCFRCTEAKQFYRYKTTKKKAFEDTIPSRSYRTEGTEDYVISEVDILTSDQIVLRGMHLKQKYEDEG